MVVWPIYRLERGVVIGIKAFFAEYERSSGRNGFDAGIRRAQPSEANGTDECGNDGKGAGLVANDGSRRENERGYGSEVIGLSECEMLGYEPKASEGCSYSRYVCSGFSTRVSRMGRSHKK